MKLIFELKIFKNIQGQYIVTYMVPTVSRIITELDICQEGESLDNCITRIVNYLKTTSLIE